MRDTGGHCTPRLYGTMLQVRALLPLETQDIEGINNTIQTMMRMAPNQHEALCSDRLQVKRDHKYTTVADCCELHEQVVHHMTTKEHANRMVPIEFGADCDIPHRIIEEPLDVDVTDTYKLKVAPLA